MILARSIRHQMSSSCCGVSFLAVPHTVHDGIGSSGSLHGHACQYGICCSHDQDPQSLLSSLWKTSSLLEEKLYSLWTVVTNFTPNLQDQMLSFPMIWLHVQPYT